MRKEQDRMSEAVDRRFVFATLLFTISPLAKPALIQRLQFDDGSAVVITHPESDRRRRIVDEYSANVRRSGKRIFSNLAALGIEPRDAIGQHRSGPRFTVFINDDIVGSAPRRWQHPFLDVLGLRIEHAYCVPGVFGEPEAI